MSRVHREPSRPKTRSVTRAEAMASVPALQALDGNLSEASVESILSDAEYFMEALAFDLPLAITAVDYSDLSESDKSLLNRAYAVE